MRNIFPFKYKTKRKLNGFLYVLPFLIGFLLCFALPLMNTVMYSFHTVRVNDTGGMKFAYSGLKNYMDLFQNEVTTTAQPMVRLFINQNLSILTNVPLIVIFSLFMALLANLKFKGRGIVRVIYFLPIIFGLEVVTDMLAITTGGEWVKESSGLFSESYISSLLMHYTSIPNSILLPVISYVDKIFDVLSQSGVQTLIYLAGLQSINPSLYEVAKIEGATGYETFWKVTIPSIMHITLFVTIYTVVDMFLKSPISEEAYSFAFEQSKIGTGSALSVIYILNVLLVLGVVLLVLRKVVKKYEK
ncbi:lactose ABC transporter permease [Anaerocolumna cellulosilytica]|uniref:Lactose ABC transporter permease n=1 Tax=Anaerocolumna cellulosilytica TaxID=433286 RepID=A0A6S6QRD6_9FIRM|nr:sugar ABC transporter permease [Anaerocolumna cellulosilytica]MBB5197863.1 ABC-type sugar transport system permease subunit [Anaerocolumna cellulosilytica]BCJ93174.1 lactose ABC transporter permease [Anaerocolumna cellulosilytica]